MRPWFSARIRAYVASRSACWSSSEEAVQRGRPSAPRIVRETKLLKTVTFATSCSSCCSCARLPRGQSVWMKKVKPVAPVGACRESVEETFYVVAWHADRRGRPLQAEVLHGNCLEPGGGLFCQLRKPTCPG